jgi:hypothetical protein
MVKLDDNKVEILGNDIEPALEFYNIYFIKTYNGKTMSVYEISIDDFMLLSKIPEEKWDVDWGWWRYVEGSNLRFYPTYTFSVNSKKMVGFYDEEYAQDSTDKFYAGIREYLCYAIGASTETNVCAIAMDLARLNGLTLGELFTRYSDN